MPLLNLRHVLRPGVLLRSAQPTGLTQEEAAHLGGFLRLVVDLRSERECSPGDWALLDVPVKRMGGKGSPSDLYRLPDDFTLGALYVTMLEHQAAWFAEVIIEIAGNLPALVHCAAGKDRTGIVVALILDLVGADEETIVRDYALTQKDLPRILEMLEVPGIPHALLEAPEEAMRTFLAELAARGGAQVVLAPHGLTPAHVELLRAGLLTAVS
ncbi:tyrosine-protein phosphatase [Nonomuraea typhae]|uniref:tyrosine-protein phosphatase n=1 Tax=Nonomuraea typhae TaxID=2603600 RepID=UPI0012FBF41E|nr:tyrosine-protein phosphatase [Nonomuraea typhae]